MPGKGEEPLAIAKPSKGEIDGEVLGGGNQSSKIKTATAMQAISDQMGIGRHSDGIRHPHPLSLEKVPL